MFERFTATAIKAVMIAQEESRRSGHNYIGVEQILLGLITVGEGFLGDGFAFKYLKKFNVTLELARAEVLKITPDGSDPVSVEIPFTPRSKRVLDLARNEAAQLRHNYIVLSISYLLLSGKAKALL